MERLLLYPPRITSRFITVRNSSCRKLIFSQVCVKNSVNSTDVHGQAGVHGQGACMAGGVCVPGGYAWQGACMTGGMQGGGGMHGRGDMHGRGACMAWGMHGRGACVAGETATAADGTHLLW